MASPSISYRSKLILAQSLTFPSGCIITSCAASGSSRVSLHSGSFSLSLSYKKKLWKMNYESQAFTTSEAHFRTVQNRHPLLESRCLRVRGLAVCPGSCWQASASPLCSCQATRMKKTRKLVLQASSSCSLFLLTIVTKQKRWGTF